MGGLTGRDGYIIRQALAYAIETIAALPPEYQEYSNRCDMLAILYASTGALMAGHLRENVARHLFHEGSSLKRNTAIDLVPENEA
jgi:hypothetical protein